MDMRMKPEAQMTPLFRAGTRVGTRVVFLVLTFLWLPHGSSPQTAPAARPAGAAAEASAAAPRDGQHDFDFNLGAWRTHVRRLLHPLSGSTAWTEYEGTHTVRPVWNGRANLGELELDGPAGHLEGLALRLYNPRARQWNVYFASSRDGEVGVPLVGQFSDGRGVFVDQETFDGRAILVRNVWSDMTPVSCRSEQAFSADGGRTWEVNWIATDTRISEAAGAAAVAPPPPADAVAARGAAGPRGDGASAGASASPEADAPPGGAVSPGADASQGTGAPAGAHQAPAARDGQHDFDFDIGTWNIHIRRLQHPLTGSSTWAGLEGTTVTRPVWNGRANLAEVEADGASGHLEILALRLYHPSSRQWSILFANRDGGSMSVPMTGDFHHGRGEFLDQEPLGDRTILVRFSIGPTGPAAASSEQAFSDDGGRTWETNWTNTFERAR
jgi:hypothetical protein